MRRTPTNTILRDIILPPPRGTVIHTLLRAIIRPIPNRTHPHTPIGRRIRKRLLTHRTRPHTAPRFIIRKRRARTPCSTRPQGRLRIITLRTP